MTSSEVAGARRNGLAELLHRSAARYPDKTALVGMDRSFTFRELDAAVDRAAAALHRRGLGRGDRLAILARNSWQFVVASYASARLGIIFVPINFMLTADEVAYILDDSDATGILVGAELCGTAEAAFDRLGREIAVRAQIGLDANQAPAQRKWSEFSRWVDEPGAAPDVAVDDDDPIRIMYTSGTESRPKGVLLSSRALISQYVSCIVSGSMSHCDIELHTLPLYHCAQLDACLGPDVYLGATSIVLPSAEPAPEFGTTDLGSLTKGYYGASAMPVEVLREIRTRLPHLALWNFYGQTELSPVATVLGPDEQDSHAGSAGRPALNVETIVVDDDDRPVPAGTIGEIVHRGPHLTLGYWRQPHLTAEAFRNGWFHSGDLGVMDEDGRLTVVDRKKDMIKTGGENVASREVEELIYQHPDVAEVAVFAVPHPRWVEAVCAVIVAKPGSDLDEADVLAHCAGRLAKYKTPKYVSIVESLPKNPTGKILKRELRAGFADHAAKETIS